MSPHAAATRLPSRLGWLLGALALALGSLVVSATPVHASTTLHWSGASGTDFSWSTAANWTENTAPVGGDILEFPASMPPGPVNDMAGLSIAAVNIHDVYAITGNPFTLTSGIMVDPAVGSASIDNTIALSGNPPIGVGSPSGTLTLSGGLSGASNLDINASGTSGTVRLTASSSYSGQTNIASGTLRVDATGGVPSSSTVTDNGSLIFNGGDDTFSGTLAGSGTLVKAGPSALTLTGDGSAFAGTTNVGQGLLRLASNAKLGGPVNVMGGAAAALGPNAVMTGTVAVANGGTFTGPAGSTATVGAIGSAGTLSPGAPGQISSTGTASLQALGTMNVQINGTGSGTYDQLAVTGAVALAGGLNVSMGYAAAPGDDFTIITYGSRSGTFDSLPGLTYFLAGGQMLQMHYLGTVHLTRVAAPTVTTLGVDNNPTVCTQFVTFTATVTTVAPGTPIGTVQFKDGGANLGAPQWLDGSGQASISSSLLSVGAHNISAVYSGDAGLNYAGSTSNTVPQTVSQASSNTTLSTNKNPASQTDPATLTAAVAGVPPATGIPAGSVQFKDNGGNFGSPVALSGAGQASISSAPMAPGLHNVQAIYSGSACFATSTSNVIAQTINTGGGQYHALKPFRIFDTRSGPGKIGAGGWKDVKITGQVDPADPSNQVPNANVSAAVLNITVTNPSAGSFVTVYPRTFQPPTTVSNINFGPDQTIANLGEITVSGDGWVSVYNAVGNTDVILDIAGYVNSAPQADTAGLFKSIAPQRILDTRGGHGPLGPNQTLDLPIPSGPFGTSGLSAVVLNVTATGGTAGSYLAVYPTGTSPNISNVNFAAGRDVPNRVIVTLGSGGSVTILNHLGYADVVVDMNGAFTDATFGGTGARYVAVTPTRILDTRPGSQVGPYNTRVQGAVPFPQAVGPVPGNAVAVVENVTVTNGSAYSYLALYPSGSPPTISDLNFATAQTVANLAVLKVGPGGNDWVYNKVGATDVVIDVSGYYI